MESLMKTIEERQAEVINAFQGYDDWMDKYEYLINLGKSLEEPDQDIKTDANSISGCQSQVWIAAEIKNGKLYYQAQTDTLITRGIIKLLLNVMDQLPPAVIAASELYFLEKIGLTANLSPSRANGLASILKQMKRLAKLASVPIG